MDDNELSMLRYSLKQCEKSYLDARDNPRYWEQAYMNSDGLLDKLPNLPTEERVAWEKKLSEWLPQMKAGANRALGERILRRINDSLASAADKLAQDSDPTYEFERLERELAHPDTAECVPEAERERVAKELSALQIELADKAAGHQVAAAADRVAFAEDKLAELEEAMRAQGDGSHTQLARVVAGNLDSAQAEIDRLPENHAEREPMVARLQALRDRFDAL